MAPAKADDENLKFLFTCFQSAVNNGGKVTLKKKTAHHHNSQFANFQDQVDIKSVAAAHSINSSAASMRLTRLRKALGSDTEAGGEDDNGKKDAVDVTPKAPKTPKSKGSAPANIAKTHGDVAGVTSPSPAAPKGKKRKLAKEDQVDALVQKAKIEARKQMEAEEAR